ncbi:MAG: hypothetical protein PVG03_05565 [Desulfarculaceae bacterium]|jgi:hypothetical protein
METYGPARQMVPDPDFEKKKNKTLAGLDPQILDPPMRDLVAGYNKLPYCYTLQCCHGHIVIPDKGPYSDWQRLPVEDPPLKALYQLAYLALVIRNNPPGQGLLRALASLAGTNPGFMQFGSPDWFWNAQGQANSFALQVSPQRSKDLDRFEMIEAEARQWMAAREQFMQGLRRILELAKAPRPD